jgi:hypothetical protein
MHRARPSGGWPPISFSPAIKELRPANGSGTLLVATAERSANGGSDVEAASALVAQRQAGELLQLRRSATARSDAAYLTRRALKATENARRRIKVMRRRNRARFGDGAGVLAHRSGRIFADGESVAVRRTAASALNARSARGCVFRSRRGRDCRDDGGTGIIEQRYADVRGCFQRWSRTAYTRRLRSDRA